MQEYALVTSWQGKPPPVDCGKRQMTSSARHAATALEMSPVSIGQRAVRPPLMVSTPEQASRQEGISIIAQLFPMFAMFVCMYRSFSRACFCSSSSSPTLHTLQTYLYLYM